jgi:hypothetical protein
MTLAFLPTLELTPHVLKLMFSASQIFPKLGTPHTRPASGASGDRAREFHRPPAPRENRSAFAPL